MNKNGYIKEFGIEKKNTMSNAGRDLGILAAKITSGELLIAGILAGSKLADNEIINHTSSSAALGAVAGSIVVSHYGDKFKKHRADRRQH